MSFVFLITSPRLHVLPKPCYAELLVAAPISSAINPRVESREEVHQVNCAPSRQSGLPSQCNLEPVLARINRLLGNVQRAHWIDGPAREGEPVTYLHFLTINPKWYSCVVWRGRHTAPVLVRVRFPSRRCNSCQLYLFLRSGRLRKESLSL